MSSRPRKKNETKTNTVPAIIRRCVQETHAKRGYSGIAPRSAGGLEALLRYDHWRFAPARVDGTCGIMKNTHAFHNHESKQALRDKASSIRPTLTTEITLESSNHRARCKWPLNGPFPHLPIWTLFCILCTDGVNNVTVLYKTPIILNITLELRLFTGEPTRVETRALVRTQGSQKPINARSPLTGKAIPTSLLHASCPRLSCPFPTAPSRCLRRHDFYSLTSCPRPGSPISRPLYPLYTLGRPTLFVPLFMISPHLVVHSSFFHKLTSLHFIVLGAKDLHE